jgi:hypothetical protein
MEIIIDSEIMGLQRASTQFISQSAYSISPSQLKTIHDDPNNPGNYNLEAEKQQCFLKSPTKCEITNSNKSKQAQFVRMSSLTVTKPSLKVR